MEKIIKHKGLVVPINRSNIDTDLIIPKQFLKAINSSGFGLNLFDGLRYIDEGYPGKKNRLINKDFVLNKSRYKGASILLTRKNFGCGSSREHAVWALKEYGFKIIIAQSFAEIFYNNALKNGILIITVKKNLIKDLFLSVCKEKGYMVNINLPKQILYNKSGKKFKFTIDPFSKYCLENGLDDIGITFKEIKLIKKFEHIHNKKNPWL
ncbi:3-isopropylmalate dehydratase small subunit [Candidatus Portiera aleyrodidarum]|uniref:3-isopropylmalate dehydratase small subunit n=1 Tax=Candidatus Portiera aleyrodidarum MED (Bemisia tabaci) TaxID=1163752 RepID=A0AAU8RR53_9GAMM|nr:3-isopropylmalate dehydratase small subunit [Candidatus Portiera aleyrodidarum]AFQ24009.1 3-isopropylmalate dehydratase, small subunit [Candidatus Portiera aleyrodidarum BT-B-HRs]AFS18775.1 3-isopropylmalate dehydratase small subunit [Candidatus Portiera aleyrodidarum BT-QVLC]AFT80398.1 3-isopropylmalate dehydratase small subunit [Candidatus Portiera aleyrodidarum BT-QVLC]AFT80679.1 3-isopropylmalate dehydratase small subunit [Candidatus Portiera aleyrodidarum BT-B-HRs]AJF23988.1 3-isopropy